VAGLVLRWLLTRKIALLAATAIALGVMAMVVILALMAGVQRFLVDHFRATQADIVVHSRELVLDEEAALRKELRSELSSGAQVCAAAPRMEMLALLLPADGASAKDEDRIAGVRILGVDWADEVRVGGLGGMLSAVSDPALRVPVNLQTAPLAKEGILLGDALAKSLGVTGPDGAGPHVLTVVAARAQTDAQGKPRFDETRSARLSVLGTFSSGHAEHDATTAVMDRRALMLLKHGRAVEPLETSGLHLKVAGALSAPVVAAELRARHPSLSVRSFEEEHRAELLAIEDQKRIMLVILSSVIVVAAVAILGMVWLMVREKTKDIGILRSMGLARWRLVALFLAYGCLLGLIGTLCGFVAGWLVATNLDGLIDAASRAFEIELLNPAVYHFEEIPVRFEGEALLSVALIAVVASLLASVIPAWRAARMNVVDCLRSD
jgi:lipoprotein-releasing system permease protein